MLFSMAYVVIFFFCCCCSSVSSSSAKVTKAARNSISAVGDPGMGRDGLRVGFEAWNFCNEVGKEEAPYMGSPRAADCFDLFLPKPNVQRERKEERSPPSQHRQRRPSPPPPEAPQLQRRQPPTQPFSKIASPRRNCSQTPTHPPATTKVIHIDPTNEEE